MREEVVVGRGLYIAAAQVPKPTEGTSTVLYRGRLSRGSGMGRDMVASLYRRRTVSGARMFDVGKSWAYRGEFDERSFQ